MSRFKALLLTGLSLIMALVCVLGVAVPANAYFSSLARITLGANTSTPTHVDALIAFQRQSDDTGVYVNWTGFTVTNCAERFQGSTKWYNIQVSIYDGNTGNHINTTYFPSTDWCDTTWHVNKSGYDEGYIRVVVRAVGATVGADEWFEYRWALWPSGGNVLEYAAWTTY